MTLNALCVGPGASINAPNHGCPYDGSTEIGQKSFDYEALVANNNNSHIPHLLAPVHILRHHLQLRGGLIRSPQ